MIKPIPDYGDLYTMEKFIEYCHSGLLIDYDGTGHYSDGVSMITDIDVKPSMLHLGLLDLSFEYVVWFNR